MREQHTLSIVDDQKRLQTEPNRPPVARRARPQGSNKTACQGQCLPPNAHLLYTSQRRSLHNGSQKHRVAEHCERELGNPGLTARLASAGCCASTRLPGLSPRNGSPAITSPPLKKISPRRVVRHYSRPAVGGQRSPVETQARVPTHIVPTRVGSRNES